MLCSILLWATPAKKTEKEESLCVCSCASCKLVSMDEHHDRQEQQENTNGALLRLADIKGSLQMLQAVKSPAKQVSKLSKSAACKSGSTVVRLH